MSCVLGFPWALLFHAEMATSLCTSALLIVSLGHITGPCTRSSPCVFICLDFCWWPFKELAFAYIYSGWCFSIVLSPLALNVTITLSECTSVENGTSLATNIASKAFDIFVYMTSEWGTTSCTFPGGLTGSPPIKDVIPREEAHGMCWS